MCVFFFVLKIFQLVTAVNLGVQMLCVYRPISVVMDTTTVLTKVMRPIARLFHVQIISFYVRTVEQMGHQNALPKLNCAMVKGTAKTEPMRKRLAVSFNSYLFKFFS